MGVEKTLFDWIVSIGGIAGAIVTIAGLLALASKPFSGFKERIENVETAVTEVKKDVKTLQTDLDHAFDKERELERTTKTTERALLALLNHSLYGNNTEEMETVKQDLEKQIWKGEH